MLKQGIEIAKHENHKERSYSTTTFASPVEIGGTVGNMAVVVREEGKNYYKVHRIYMPDGKQFVFADKKNSNAETAGLQNANLSRTNVANTNISQAEEKINTISKKSLKNFSKEELDGYLRENVKGYNVLGAANQGMIRALIRSGLSANVEEDFLLSCARISTRSGLNIVFNKELCFIKSDGSFADGAVDLANNRIIVNPEATSRTGEQILIHELTHAIYNKKDGVLKIAKGIENMPKEERKRIAARYLSKTEGLTVADIADELNAHYAEKTLSDKKILESLVADNPTVKEKILSFFKGAQKDYAADVKLTGAARKLYGQYKRLFDSFSDGTRKTLGNQYGNANVTPGERAAQTNAKRRYSLSKSFAEQIDDVIAGIHSPYLDLCVGETPTVLMNLGFPGTPLLMRNSKVKEILNKHSEMSVELIKQILEAIKDPLLILKSKTNPNESVVLITELNTARGEMVVPVWLNQDGVYLDVELDLPTEIKTNFIATAYGRNVKGLIEYAYRNEGIVYKNPDNKKISDLLARHGLRLPASLEVTDFNINISNSEGNVNNDLKNNKKKFALAIDGEKAVMNTERIDDLITSSGAGKRADYARSWITSINPTDFINLTVQAENQDRAVFDTNVRGDYGDSDMGSYDYLKALQENKRQTPYLQVNIDTGKVIGHNGRHRMRALEQRGIKSVEIVVEFFDSDGYWLKTMNGEGTPLTVISSKTLRNQWGADNTAIIKNIMPLNQAFRDKILAEYGDSKASASSIKFALPETDSQGNKLSKEQREFFKDSKVVDGKGRLQVVYHGTNSRNEISKWNPNTRLYDTDYQKFNVFKKQFDGQGGHFFTDNRDNAGGYGTTLYEVYLNLVNPLIIDCKGKIWSNIEFEGQANDTREWAEYAKAHGYDGVIFKNVYDGVDYGALGDKISVYVAFKSRQIKDIANVNPTASSDIRFALPLIDEYTETQYNNYGWVRVNDVLTKQQWADFNAKYRKLKLKRETFVKTAAGEYIIPVNNQIGEQFGIDNVLVYAKGSFENVKVSKVVQINLDNETDIEKIRRDIYAREDRNSDQTDDIINAYYGEELVREYRLADSPTYQESKAEWRRQSSGSESGGADGNNKPLQDGRGNTQGNRGNGKLTRIDVENGTEYYSDGTKKKFALPEDGEKYSYDTLTKKPDMKVTVIDDSKTYNPNAGTREKVINNGIANAKKAGKDNGINAIVFVKDLGKEVLVSRKSLRHGLDRRLSLLAPITENVGEILKNAICLNEMHPKVEQATNAYALVSIARNKQGQPYIVMFVVNEYTNELQEIDVLYSINGKDIGAFAQEKRADRALAPDIPSKKEDYLTDSTISISKVLEYVNKHFPDILSMDALRHFGRTERPSGIFANRVKYAIPEDEKESRKANGGLTKGERAKFVANNTRRTVFFKSDVEEIVDGIFTDTLIAEISDPSRYELSMSRGDRGELTEYLCFVDTRCAVC